MPQDENLRVDQQESRSENPNPDRETREDAPVGKSIPIGRGQIADEEMSQIGGGLNDRDCPTGQDHSTEDRGGTIPDHGVGAVQDSSDTTSDIARIED